MIKINCDFCKKIIYIHNYQKRNHHHFCSRKCQTNYQIQSTNKEVTCLICGTKFITKNWIKKQTCSKVCWRKLAQNNLKNTIIAQFKNGRVVWNKGLTKETDERVKKQALSLIGHKLSKEAIEKIKNKLTGRKLDIQTCKKISKALKYFYIKNPEIALTKFKNCDFSIKGPSKPQKELFNKIKSIFPNLDIKLEYWLKNTRRRADIFIKELNLVIEYDCWYWHTDEEDAKRDKEIKSAGYNIIHYKDRIPSKEELQKNIGDFFVK